MAPREVISRHFVAQVPASGTVPVLPPRATRMAVFLVIENNDVRLGGSTGASLTSSYGLKLPTGSSFTLEGYYITPNGEEIFAAAGAIRAAGLGAAATISGLEVYLE